MKIILSFVIAIVILAIGAISIDAQPLQKNNGYALIFPKTGDGFSGNIIRIEKDTLVVYSTDYKYIAKKDIGKIILHVKHEGNGGFAIGSILGTYAANYLFGTANGQPGSFLAASVFGSYQNYNTSGSIVGILFLGVVFGGGIGWLTDHPKDEDQIFLFGGRGDDFSRQWVEFEKAFSSSPSSKRSFRLSISGGSVFATTSSAYNDQFVNAGYAIQNNYNGNYYATSLSSTFISQNNNLQYPTNINWARSAALSYAITDHIEAGVELAWLSEPSFIGNKYVNTYNTYDLYDYAAVIQRLDTKGYYLIGSYTSFLGNNNDFEAIITGGIGIANVKFDLSGQFEKDSNRVALSSGSDSYSYHKTVLSALISGSLNYYLYDSFSFGLTANYFFAGSTTAKAMPTLGITEQPITFGNADIGFTLGLHF